MNHFEIEERFIPWPFHLIYDYANNHAITKMKSHFVGGYESTTNFLDNHTIMFDPLKIALPNEKYENCIIKVEICIEIISFFSSV